MNDNVRKIFDMLGVEPNEEFKIKSKATGKEYDDFYEINENLNAFYKGKLWQGTLIGLRDLLNGTCEIVKLPKKKKLRDLTMEEYKKWVERCCPKIDCDNCPFFTLVCNISSSSCWVNHKDLFSDKCLDQEVEVPE